MSMRGRNLPIEYAIQKYYKEFAGALRGEARADGGGRNYSRQGGVKGMRVRFVPGDRRQREPGSASVE